MHTRFTENRTMGATDLASRVIVSATGTRKATTPTDAFASAATDSRASSIRARPGLSAGGQELVPRRFNNPTD